MKGRNMSNKKLAKQSKKQKVNPLFIAAMAVTIIAIAVVFVIPKKEQKDLSANETEDVAGDITDSLPTESESDSSISATLNDNGDMVILTADITENATFYNVDADGVSMGLFAVKASDGTIRTAFNTCQICNGSPYAYFTQDGDNFQCQNCGNIYGVDMIEKERGGCNPVPITSDEKTVTDTEIIIPAKLIEENAGRFNNWMQF